MHIAAWVRSATALSLVAATAAAEERYVEVAVGETLHVVEDGRGEPVVLVPGLLGSAYAFRRVVPLLVEAGHRAIVIEPLGVGASSTPSGADYSLTAQADRIAVALEKIGVERATIVAHAVAGSMAFRLAHRHPERVKGIVSLDGGIAEAAATPGLRRAMRFSWLIRIFGGRRRIRGQVRKALTEESVDPGWVTDEIVKGYMAAGVRDLGGTIRALREMAKATEPELISTRLERVRCPVRLVVGPQGTRGISEAEIQIMTQRLSAFSIDRVDHAGHFVFEEDPLAVVTAVEHVLESSRIAASQVAAARGAGLAR